MGLTGNSGIPASQRKYYLKKRQFLNDLKDNKPCSDCGVAYRYYVMDFDHRPGELKIKHIAHLSTYSEELILREVAKCDLVCSNCHRERTHGRRKA